MSELKRIQAWHEFLLNSTRPNCNQRNKYAQWWRGKKQREQAIETLIIIESEEKQLILNLHALTSAFSDLSTMNAQIGEALEAQKAALGPFEQAIRTLLNIKSNLALKRQEIDKKKTKLLNQFTQYIPEGWP